MNCCEEISGQFAEALREAVQIFHTAEEPFDQNALANFFAMLSACQNETSFSGYSGCSMWYRAHIAQEGRTMDDPLARILNHIRKIM